MMDPGGPDRITWLIRKGMPRLVLLVMLGVAVRQASGPLTNDDTFFHLRLGHEFLSGWAISDPGSVTSLATRDWVPTQWAGQVAMGGMEDWFGLSGVAWLAGFLFAAYVVVLYVACRQVASPLTSALVTVIVFLCSATGLSARPQVVSYVLATVVTVAWLKTAQDRRLRWWIVPLIGLWSLFHGMWPIGLATSVVAVLGCALDLRPGRRWLLLAGLIPLLAALAVCLTPVGPRIYVEILSVGSRREYFEEWGAPDFTDLTPLLLAGLLALVLVVRLRQAPLSWIHLLLLLEVGGWAIYSARTIPVAASGRPAVGSESTRVDEAAGEALRRRSVCRSDVDAGRYGPGHVRHHPGAPHLG
jgi:hypothetical protein